MEREWSGDGGGCGFFSLFFFSLSLSLSLSPFVSQSVNAVFVVGVESIVVVESIIVEQKQS